MAEVSVAPRGAALRDDGEQKHITITRRSFRDGESDYVLNGAKSGCGTSRSSREERVGAQTYATDRTGASIRS